MSKNCLMTRVKSIVNNDSSLYINKIVTRNIKTGSYYFSVSGLNQTVSIDCKGSAKILYRNGSEVPNYPYYPPTGYNQSLVLEVLEDGAEFIITDIYNMVSGDWPLELFGTLELSRIVLWPGIRSRTTIDFRDCTSISGDIKTLKELPNRDHTTMTFEHCSRVYGNLSDIYEFGNLTSFAARRTNIEGSYEGLIANLVKNFNRTSCEAFGINNSDNGKITLQGRTSGHVTPLSWAPNQNTPGYTDITHNGTVYTIDQDGNIVSN